MMLLTGQITSILSNTKFNDVALFDGSAGTSGTVTIQTGSTSSDTVDISFGEIDLTDATSVDLSSASDAPDIGSVVAQMSAFVTDASRVVSAEVNPNVAETLTRDCLMASADSTPDRVKRDSEILDRVDYRLAETEAEKEAIYSLRYRAYLHEGAITSRADRRLKDRFDDLPTVQEFGRASKRSFNRRSARDGS
eukprot:gene64090-87651_t